MVQLRIFKCAYFMIQIMFLALEDETQIYSWLDIKGRLISFFLVILRALQKDSVKLKLETYWTSCLGEDWGYWARKTRPQIFFFIVNFLQSSGVYDFGSLGSSFPLKSLSSLISLSSIIFLLLSLILSWIYVLRLWDKAYCWLNVVMVIFSCGFPLCMGESKG